MHCVHVSANVCLCIQISVAIWHVYRVCFARLQYMYIMYVPVQCMCVHVYVSLEGAVLDSITECMHKIGNCIKNLINYTM